MQNANSNKPQWGTSSYAAVSSSEGSQSQSSIKFYNPYELSAKPTPSHPSQQSQHQANWYPHSVPNANQGSLLSASSDPWDWSLDDAKDSENNAQPPTWAPPAKTTETQDQQDFSSQLWHQDQLQQNQNSSLTLQETWPNAHSSFPQSTPSHADDYTTHPQNHELHYWDHVEPVQQQPSYYGGGSMDQHHSYVTTSLSWSGQPYNTPYQQQWEAQSNRMNQEALLHPYPDVPQLPKPENQGLETSESEQNHLNLANDNVDRNPESSTEVSELPVSSSSTPCTETANSIPQTSLCPSLPEDNGESQESYGRMSYGSQEQVDFTLDHNSEVSQAPDNNTDYEQHELSSSVGFTPFFSDDIYERDGENAPRVHEENANQQVGIEERGGGDTANEEKVVPPSSRNDWPDPSATVSQLEEPHSGFGLEDAVNKEVPESPTVRDIIPSLKKLSVSALPPTRASGDGEQLDESPPRMDSRGSGAGMECGGDASNQQTLDGLSSSGGSSVPMVHQDRVQGVRIRHREGSPFKPPPKTASKGHSTCIVQQEITTEVENTSSTCPEAAKHDANLETEPDNLERPPDMELVNTPSCLSTAYHRHHQRELYNSTPSTALWESPELPNITLVPASPASSTTSSQRHKEGGQDHQRQAEAEGKSSTGVNGSGNRPPSRQSPLGGEGAQVVPGKPWQVPVSLTKVDAKQRENQVDASAATSVPDTSVPTLLAMDLIHRTSPLGEGQAQNQVSVSRPPLMKEMANAPAGSLDIPKTISLDSGAPALSQPPLGGGAYSSVQPSRGGYDPSKQLAYVGEPSGKPETSLAKRRNSHDGIQLLELQKIEARPRNDHPSDLGTLKNAVSSGNLGMMGERSSHQDLSRSGKGYYREDERQGDPRYLREYGGHSSPRSVSASREDLREDRSRRRDYDRAWDERRYRSYEEAYYERERSRPPSRASVGDPYSGDYARHPLADPSYDAHQRSDPYRRGSREIDKRDRRDYSQYERQHHYPDKYSGYSRMDDYYQQHSGHYGRGYDYSGYFRRESSPFYPSYSDPYRYPYGTYNYGYHDELYRTDPRYREHYDQYRAYYASLGYDRASYGHASSVHSGRSSVNELERDTTGYGQDYDQTSLGARDYSSYSQEPRQDSTTSYSDGYSDSTKLDSDLILATSPARLTPLQFSHPHTIARFNNQGQLVKALAHLPSLGQIVNVEIHDVQKLLSSDPTFTDLSNFPGPLIRQETHKNDVIHFCLQKAKAAQESLDFPDRSSVILLWELLILLLRQNGSVAGTDIAELLLKDHDILKPALPETSEFSCAEVGSNASPESTSPDEGIVIAQDTTSVDIKEQLTCRFREYLLFGRKKDALEWAMKHDLWGHALFLASKMDTRTYSNVMARFANSLSLQDPLQTLYQLMSGRQPTAVTHVADEKWGDWRPHLAMILSNPSRRHELDQKSITALGDTLAGRGLLHASHFCYLMAELEFGTYENKTSKLILLGSDHRLPFQQFATNEAIQCTEIYEYARSLADPSYVLPQLQMYKLVYAARLADYGFNQEALHYCEVLSNQFHEKTGSSSLELLSQACELSSKLKYFDPQYVQGEGETEDLDDPLWLTHLLNLKRQVQDGIIPVPPNQGYLGTSSFSADTETEFGPQSTASMQDYSQSGTYGQAAPSVPDHSQSPPSSAVYGSDQQTSHISHIGTDYSHPWSSYDQQKAHPVSDQTQSNQNLNQWNSGTMGAPLPHMGLASDYSSVGGSGDGSLGMTLPPAPPPMAAPQQTTEQSSSQSSFDYYGATTKQENSSTATSRQYSWDQSDGLGSASADSRRGSLVSHTSSGLREQRRESYGQSATSTAASKLVDQKRVTKKEEVSKAGQQASRSWLGGIFSRFMPKAPNQMILPDDKNPSIVWDPVKCKWVDKDGDADDTDDKALGPPKDSELTGNDRLPAASSGGPPAGNKFQRVKTRGMRQNYVDILNPNQQTVPSSSSALLPPNLFPTMENTAPRQNFLLPQPTTVQANPAEANPGSVSYATSTPAYGHASELNNNDDTASKAHMSSNELTNPVPMMFNPAQFSSGSISAPSTNKTNRLQRMPYKT